MSDHVRESATATNLLIEGGERAYPPNHIVADCSCGGWYFAPAGGDEYAAVEAAHQAHVDSVEGAAAAVREFRAKTELRLRGLPAVSSQEEKEGEIDGQE